MIKVLKFLDTFGEKYPNVTEMIRVGIFVVGLSALIGIVVLRESQESARIRAIWESVE